MTPELSRIVDVRHMPEKLRIEASEAERAALAERFGLEAITRLVAEVTLVHADPGVTVAGRIEADVIQLCAVSGDPLPVRIAEDLALRFVPATGVEAEEIELSADELDEIAFEGAQFDLGEAIAQTLGLAVDPYAVGPDADRARREAGILDEAANGPFAALAALKK